jgi:predicted Zn-dependent protease
MADFLHAMDQYVTTESRIKGEDEETFSFFSSHPQTGDRVAEAAQEAGRYQGKGIQERDRYLSMIGGMTYGDSVEQGVTRGNVFYHPKMGFSFAAPEGYNIINQPDQVAAIGDDGAVIVLDMVANRRRLSPVDYMVEDWMKGERMSNPEAITINGFRAATDAFPGTLNGRPVNVRIVAIQWSPDEVFRFQIAIPEGAGARTIDGLKRSTYSFRRMTETERADIKPQRIELVTARSGDTVETLARRMIVDKAPVDLFRALNTLSRSDRVEAGRRYKIIVE